MKIGSIVYSLAGRDKCRFLVVTGFLEDKPLVVDGKERPLKRPKPKNPKHLKATQGFLTEKEMVSDKSVRKALKSYKLSIKDEF